MEYISRPAAKQRGIFVYSIVTDFKSTLVKLNENLILLREREAKYGDNAPLDLLNQIANHSGYIFIRRYLLEYFASLTPEDIERLSSEIESKRAQPA